MKKNFFKASAILLGVILLSFTIAATIEGKWVGKTNMDGNDIPLTYNFKADGDKLTGSAESPYGTSSIEHGKIKGDSIMFTTTVSGMEIPQAGKVYADSVILDILVNNNTLHAKLTKAK